MTTLGNHPSGYGLEHHGIDDPGSVYWNLTTTELVEQALIRREVKLADNGAMAAHTGSRTGRSPDDRFIVDESTSRERIDWGKVNRPISEEAFEKLHQRVRDHYRGRDLFVRDCFAGADPRQRLAIRVVTETAWHNLFARQLFVRPAFGSTTEHVPEFTVLNAPSCLAVPAEDGTRSEAFVVVHFGRKLVLIGGTAYAGEIKKSIFSVANYVWPVQGVLTMHCSANIGPSGDTALFFGLSGTGKTTLSADPERALIGDDEHSWSDTGVQNIEGGCYAKCIRLSRELEPQIYDAIRFGAVLENVVMDPAERRVDYDADTVTENTRVAYPLPHIPNAVESGTGDHPRNIVFLTCDAFGVLPPVSRLSPQQAMYHFLSGYTAKVAGTEAGVTEPQATFSSCFGAPFLPLPPTTYARMLGERMAAHGAACWLINTGWSGGGYGVGKRMHLPHTRAMVNAALKGDLGEVAYEVDPVFGLQVPRSCPKVPEEVLNPKTTWADGAAYDAKAHHLAGLFVENFKRFADVPADVVAAGPRR